MKVKKVLTPYNVAYSPQEERDPIWLKSEIKYHFELLAALTKEHAQMIEERRALEACSELDRSSLSTMRKGRLA